MCAPKQHVGSTNQGKRNVEGHRAMNKFLRVSRRHGDTGETIWVRPDTIRNITLPWSWDVQFNPKAADYPMPYRVAFDGAERIEHASTSAEELRAAGITLPSGLHSP